MTTPRAVRRLLLLALLAAGAASAEEAPPPGAAEAPSAAVATTPRDGDRERVRGTALGLVVELRYDVGFRQLLEVEYSNGRRVRVRANDGTTVAVGASFLPALDGRLVTRAAVGLKVDAVRAGNGHAVFAAVPLEVMEVAYAGPLRLGAGPSLLIAPRLHGTGFLSDSTERMASAPGAVAEAEWIFAPGAGAGVGLRASWHRLTTNGVTLGAPAVGLALRVDRDLTRRSR